MNQETAKKLFEEGAIFLLLDVPVNTVFGIDYNNWQTGPNFKGVKMIPPGLHYIYFNATDKEGNIGLRSSFFYDFKPREILAKKWNPQNECIDDYEFSQEEIQQFEMNKKDLDRFLGAYPYDEYKRWLSLTNNLNYDFVMKLVPDLKIISSGTNLIGEKFKSKPAEGDQFKVPSSLQEAESRLPKMEVEKGTNINFSNLPNKFYPRGTDPLKITECSIDLSDRLESLIKESMSNSEKNLLCEIQFSFVCFLIGQVYDAFEQWKNLIHLVCNSEKAILKYPQMYIEFLNVFYFQLKELPEDFFTDILTQNNFLAVNLHNLFDNISDTSAESTSFRALDERAHKFKNYLEQKFQINFESCPDEYAPVVVEQENE